MNIKILAHSAVLRNTLVFLCFSLGFFQVLNALSAGVSAIDWVATKNLYVAKWSILVFFFLGNYAILKGKKFGKYMLLLMVINIFYESVFLFLKDFDKVVLLFSILYLIIGYYFYLLIESELEEAVYNPGFHKKFLLKTPEYKISVVVDTKLMRYEGWLTNWDEFGCFVFNKGNEFISGKHVRVTTEFEGKKFVQDGVVATSYGQGVGIRFNQKRLKRSETLTWGHFYDIISARGYKTRFENV